MDAHLERGSRGLFPQFQGLAHSYGFGFQMRRTRCATQKVQVMCFLDGVLVLAGTSFGLLHARGVGNEDVVFLQKERRYGRELNAFVSAQMLVVCNVHSVVGESVETLFLASNLECLLRLQRVLLCM